MKTNQMNPESSNPVRKDAEREERISAEIIAGAGSPEEQIMNWNDYLYSALDFPFTAHCIKLRAISPLEVDDEVVITGIADVEEWLHEIFVTMRWERRELAVPLSQLQPIGPTDESTKQAVADWHYWLAQGNGR